MSEQLSSIFICAENWGECSLCGEHDDRRFGVCFRCSDYAKVSTSRGIVIDIRNGEEHLIPWVVDPMAAPRNAFRKAADELYQNKDPSL